MQERNRMPVTDYELPVPYIKVSSDLQIVTYSKEAQSIFQLSDSLSSIVDQENIAKLKNFMYASEMETIKPIEISLITKDRPLELFDIYVSWDHYLNGHLVCIKKEQNNKFLEEMVYNLQSRLSSTDFELFEKKEELEQAFLEIDQLSGPFILLSDQVALIPMFGDITTRKINAIKENTLKSAYKHDLDAMLFDFTGVGSITLEGLQQMESLFTTLAYMGGIESVIVGVKPEHAIQMNAFHTESKFSFLSTLQEAMKKYI